jgi:hypothetical protein
MKDFPVFTTQHGAASLVLKQIPYSGCAYITIQDSCSPGELLKECSDFCQAVGASSVYASGHDYLAKFPRHTEIVLMRCQREQLDDTDAALFPVCAETLERFRQIYNDAMKAVPNASCLTADDAEKVLKDGNGYFVHRKDQLLGIGIAGGERIEAIVSLIAGCGSDVLRALNHALSGSTVEVEVATANQRAISLYNKLGFVCCKELSKWYKII